MRRHLLLIVALALAGVSLVGVGLANGTYVAQPSSRMLTRGAVRLPSDAPKSTTLLETWQLAEQHARTWRADPAIAFIGSVDLPGSDSYQAGLDGRRRAWQVDIVAPSAPRLTLRTRIVDGTVVEAVEVPGGDELRAIPQKPSIDSPEAVRLVTRQHPGFGAGDGKARGVHFSVAFPPNEVAPRFVVRGMRHQAPVTVEIDVATAKTEATREYTYAKFGGVLYSDDAGLTWRASDLVGRYVTSIASMPADPAKAFASVADPTGILIYETNDGGTTWKQVGRLPDPAGNWPFDILVTDLPTGATAVIVGTRAGLWVSRDGGKSWDAVSGLPSGPTQWLARGSDGAASKVFVTISTGVSRGVYSSTDLENWGEETPIVSRLSTTLGARAVIAIAEDYPGGGRVLQGAQSEGLRLPDGVMRVAGAFDGSAPLLAGSSSEIHLSRDGGVTWTRTLEGSFASLAVAPDFPTSGVALAGGFRAGIYRTDDGGGHWTPVLPNPSEIVPGTSVIGEIRFLSPTRVLAVNGGALTWQTR